MLNKISWDRKIMDSYPSKQVHFEELVSLVGSYRVCYFDYLVYLFVYSVKYIVIRRITPEEV